jgi:hypothetical protein
MPMHTHTYIHTHTHMYHSAHNPNNHTYLRGGLVACMSMHTFKCMSLVSTSFMAVCINACFSLASLWKNSRAMASVKIVCAEGICIHTYIHACIPFVCAYTHTYIHTYIPFVCVYMRGCVFCLHICSYVCM